METAVNSDHIVIGAKVHGITGANALLSAWRVIDQLDLTTRQHRAETLVGGFDLVLDLVHLYEGFTIW